jgi:predicted GIY-YIG superfamily endonuclease
MSGFAYALACADDNFYVGKTKDLVTRFKKHKEGGSQWTKLHPALSIVDLVNDDSDDFQELAMTLRFMQQYGTARVRGGPFAAAEIRDSDLPIIEMLSTELPFDEPRVVAVLACAENRYFVDSWPLADLPSRFAEHCSDAAPSAFTRRFPARAITELVMDGPGRFEHLRLTLKSMLRHGMHNVRGSVFCSGEVQLSNAEVKLITRLIRCNLFPTRWSPPGAEVDVQDVPEEEA